MVRMNLAAEGRNLSTLFNCGIRLSALRLLILISLTSTVQAQLPNLTNPLESDGDIASEMISGIDRFLLRQIDLAKQHRQAEWAKNVGSAEFVDAKRKRLAHLLGVCDARMRQGLKLNATLESSGSVAKAEQYTAYSVRWDVLADPAKATSNLVSIQGEGILLVPNQSPTGMAVVVPDASELPEQLCGLVPGLSADEQLARRLAESGMQVVVPSIISRTQRERNGRANLTDREYLHRSAYLLGRQLAGYEVQKILAVVDWFETSRESADIPIVVAGRGEGGMLGLYASALDERVSTAGVAGYFGPRERCWDEPLDRNVFDRLTHFGDAEIGRLITPRRLVLGNFGHPTFEFSGEGGGAPAQLKVVTKTAFESELKQLRGLLTEGQAAEIVVSDSVSDFGDALAGRAAVELASRPIESGVDFSAKIADRIVRQVQQVDRHNQALLRESDFVRQEYFSRVDYSSLQAYQESIEAYRSDFQDDVIGRFDLPLKAPNARSRQSWKTPEWTGHEIVLDVFDDVIAYGVLLVPSDLKPDEKRPVVVCQHGLEGRPTDTFLNDHRAYHDFAAKLCERGFIVFAPQNPYIFKDRFRTLQRKANALGRTLFSVIVPQHQQIVNWLKTQPCVDPDRIGFYGLSYGGKSAMRIPALVTDYCLSICSADFNEWVLKNASTREKFSYVWTGEYEIFEWDLGSTFNYFEMAALICPRPFMVERGHFDGVGVDHWVAHEYAKVRNLYAAKLGISDRTQIEWFVGPHTINGQGTYDFLHRHLNWPKPAR